MRAAYVFLAVLLAVSSAMTVRLLSENHALIKGSNELRSANAELIQADAKLKAADIGLEAANARLMNADKELTEASRNMNRIYCDHMRDVHRSIFEHDLRLACEAATR